MGGQDATRGILVQCLIALLDALEHQDWDSFTIEPLIQSQKVDILWQQDGHPARVTQVKSSRSSIELHDASKWASELRNSYDAKTYELTLVGFVAKKLVGIYELSGVVVTVKQLDLRAFLDICAHKVDKYLNAKELNLDAKSREIIVKVLLAELLLLSVDGTEVLRGELDSLLVDLADALQETAYGKVSAVAVQGCRIQVIEQGKSHWGISKNIWADGVPTRGIYLRIPVFIHNKGNQPGTIQNVKITSFESESKLIEMESDRVAWEKDNLPGPREIDVGPNIWLREFAGIIYFKLKIQGAQELALRLSELSTTFEAICEFSYVGPNGLQIEQLTLSGSLVPLREMILSYWRPVREYQRLVQIAEGQK